VFARASPHPEANLEKCNYCRRQIAFIHPLVGEVHGVVVGSYSWLVACGPRCSAIYHLCDRLLALVEGALGGGLGGAALALLPARALVSCARRVGREVNGPRVTSAPRVCHVITENAGFTVPG